ncbi:MAG: restriction endonuclease subunit S [archaeon]
MKQQTKQTGMEKIPEGWEVKKIEDVAEVVGGGTPSTKIPKYWEGEIAWITPRDLSNYLSVHISRGERNITQEGLENSSAKLLPKGAVLLTSRAPIGYVVIADNEMTTNQGFRSLIPKEKEACSEFLYYLLKWKCSFLKSIAFGSTFGELSGTTLKNLEFLFPNLAKQKSIAKILSDLDAKIELNNRMNKVLETIGMNLFKKWFIDGKKREWKTKKLGDFIFVERGLSYKGSGLCEDGVPLINLGNVAPKNNFRYEGLKFYSGEYKKRNLVRPGDLIIANTDITQKREVLGSCLIVPSDLGANNVLFTHHIYAIRNKDPKKILPKYFLSYLLQTPEYRERATGFATGTTVLALPEDAILNFEFDMPDKKLLDNFERIVSYIQEKSSNNILESRRLAKIRDLLLPKLMGGEIRVR